MSTIRNLAAISLSLICGCAQVPKESIELSDTVGRDIAAIETSHIKFIDLVYDTYEKDVNSFVDSVYVPYYVRESLQKPSGKRLLAALTEAGQSGSTPGQQKDAFEIAELWLQEAHRRVAHMRGELLAPLRQQRSDIKSALSGAYARVKTANSAVTGYLASLVKVTDLQNELLSKLGVPKLSDQVGEAALKISSQLDKSLPAADQQLKDVEAIKSKLQTYLNKWRSSN